MTENRRIFLNAVASYGRSLFAIACAIFTSRWVLAALGEVDYGLLGVVGSLMAFLAFVNGVMSAGVSRFYAIAIGNARAADDKAAALEESRRWFSIATVIHLALALLFVAVCLPIGAWVVSHGLVIPAERIADSLTVYRLSCLSCFVGMLAVPYTAMFAARQEIAVVTGLSLTATAALFLFSWYMVCHTSVTWMVPFSVFTCLSAVLPCLVYAVYAHCAFPECRFRWGYARDGRRVMSLLKFVVWGMVGPLGMLLRGQGTMILVNFLFGPSVNAALALSRTVSDKSNTLSEAIKGAMIPAIVQACGAGDTPRMQRLVFRMCRFALVASLLVVIPLALELRTVLGLWLVTPPAYVHGLALCALAEYLVYVSTCGFDTAVYAKGRLALYQCSAGAMLLMTLPVLAFVGWAGGGVYAIGLASVLMSAAFCGVRLVVAARLTGLSVRAWIRQLALPALGMLCVSVTFGSVSLLAFPASVARVAVTAFLTVVSGAGFAWWLVLDEEERQTLRQRLGRLRRRVARGDGNVL